MPCTHYTSSNQDQPVEAIQVNLQSHAYLNNVFYKCLMFFFFTYCYINDINGKSKSMICLFNSLQLLGVVSLVEWD